MADETVLESLVVRLTGDGSLYQQMLTQAGEATKAATTTIETATRSFDQFKNTLQSAGQAVLSYVASWNAFGRLEGIFNKFVEHEDVELKLKAAIEANGHSLDVVLPKYKAFASYMAEVTTHSTDSNLALLQQAENFGITGAAAERAVRNVIAAQASGLPASIRMMTMLEQGQTMMLNRVLPGIRAIKDPTEKAAYAQERLAKMFKTAEAEAAGIGGQIKQLTNAYSGLQKELGAVVAIAIHPIVEGVKETVKWFRSLSQATKESIVVIGGVAAGIIALTGAIATAGVVFNVAFGGSGYLIGIIATTLIGAASGAAALVADLGGVAKATEYLKEVSLKAWDWLLPVRQALASLWDQLLVTGRDVWNAVKTYAVNAWKSILGSSTVTWDQIRDTIRDSLLFAEFTLTHFGQVSEFVWTGIRLAAVTAYEEIKFTFSDRLPAVFKWFANNWGTFHKGLVDIAVGYIKFTGDAWELVWNRIDWSLMWKGFELQFKLEIAGLAAIGSRLPEILLRPALLEAAFSAAFSDAPKQARKSLEEELRGLGKDVTDTVAKVNRDLQNLDPLVLPQRQITALEQQLRTLYETQKSALGESFAEFRRRKLEEFARVGVLPPASQTKTEIDKHMDAIAKGVKEGREKVDFVLAGSVEAALHVAEYRATLELAFDQSKKGHPEGGEEGYAGGGTGGGGAGLLIPSVVPSPALPSGAGIETTDTKLLRRMVELLEIMVVKDGDKPKVASVVI